PVNAILEADRWRKGREWEYTKTKSVCLSCSNACDITVSTKDGRIMKINAGAVEGSSERYICAYGRFGFDYIDSDTRITSPMKRVNGELKETTWQDAIEIVAKELRRGRKDSGFISTASILNEDALALKIFTSEVVKTKDVDTTVSLYGDVDTLISDSADIDGADLFVLVDLDPNQWKRVLPALDAIIRRRVKGGTKLITINSSESSIASVATVNLVEDEAGVLAALAKALIDKGLTGDKKLASAVSNAVVTEAIEKAASLFVEAKNPVILTSPAMYHASANISLLKGTAVSVPIESNAKGVIMMGLTTEGKSYRELLSGGLSLLYVIGEIPITHRFNVDFLIVQNSHLTELAKQADIILPSVTSLETEGSIVDYIGRLKYVRKAVEPAGEAKQHRDIFIELSKVMGSPIKEPKETEIKKAINIKAKPSVSPFKKKEGVDISMNEMIESINASVINGSRLLWLKEVEKTVFSTSS
ncbi:MAG: molybdopterin-dependent oxidoreductase, partial [Nitrospirota bacterium]